MRVPLIFEWDGKIAPGTTNKTPIAGYDLFPTLINMVGVNKPAHLKFDGIAINNILRNKNQGYDPAKRAFYWNYPHYTGKPDGKPSNAIVEGDWKLIHFIEDDSKELYNLKTDIAEENNLIEKYPKKAEELYHNLDNWLKEVKAKIPDKNPNYNPSLPSGWPESLIK